MNNQLNKYKQNHTKKQQMYFVTSPLQSKQMVIFSKCSNRLKKNTINKKTTQIKFSINS